MTQQKLFLEFIYTYKINEFVLIMKDRQTSILLTICVSAFTAILISALTVLSLYQSNFLQSTRVTGDKMTVEQPRLQEINSIPNIVEQTAPAVVSITISADIPIIERYYEEYNPFGDLFGRGFGFSIPQERQIGTEEREIGGGTGFFVSVDGYIITNRHVVENDNAKYSVITNGGESYEAKVIAKDPSLDIAVIKIDTEKDMPFLKFGDSTKLRLGETVIAIGNALAEFPNTISTGVVAGLSRNITATDGRGSFENLEGVIQTDAAINRGNSGGPLLNIYGEVIGVNVAAGGGENIGFALPAEVVRSVYKSVAEHGEIVRPYIGIRYTQINEEIVTANNLKVDYGVLIARGDNYSELAVIPGSPADKAGLEENDIILEIDGTKLDKGKSLGSIIRQKQIGESIQLKVLRNGTEKDISITLEKFPD